MPAPNAKRLRRYQVYRASRVEYLGYHEAWGATQQEAVEAVICQKVERQPRGTMQSVEFKDSDGNTYVARRVV